MCCQFVQIVVATGDVSTFAGLGGDCYELDGTGTSARFDGPRLIY